MRFHILGITLYSYIVVYTGALVRHTDSSLICRDWPLCLNDSPAWPANMYEWIQMGHRFAAALIFFWIAYAAYLAVKNYKDQRVIYWGWIIAFILVTLQATTGALTVFTRLNLFVALAHALIISCLFGLLCYFNLIASRSKLRR
jgi:heme a synthase